MDGYLVKGPVSLPRGSMLRIDEGAGMLLYVWEGEVWFTQEGSSKDHLLRAGQGFRVDRGGAAVAHAFRRSMVSLSSPTPGIPAQCISVVHPHGALPTVLHRAEGSRTSQALRKWLAGLLAPLTASG
jgi:Protein of unknown function (DUF2917)